MKSLLKLKYARNIGDHHPKKEEFIETKIYKEFRRSPSKLCGNGWPTVCTWA